MNDEEAFLDTIFTNIDDITPRLVYADWLEERGEAERAENIRVVCDGQSRFAGSSSALLERCLENYLQHEEEWERQCGIMLTWRNVAYLYRRRFEETIAWCGIANNRWRAAGLNSTSLRNVKRGGKREKPDQQRNVALISRRRRDLLDQLKISIPLIQAEAKEGRILAYYPYRYAGRIDAVNLTDSFLNAEACPPCDTWLWYSLGDDLMEWHFSHGFLLSWVPPSYVNLVSEVIFSHHGLCWATDVDGRLTLNLREHGLLF